MKAALRCGLAAAGLLAAATALLWWHGARDLRARVQASTDAAAQAAADDTALRIAAALEAGVPLARLQGLPALLQRQLAGDAALARLCVRTGAGVLAAAPGPCPEAGTARLHVAPVMQRGTPVAQAWAEAATAPWPLPPGRWQLAALAALGAALLAAHALRQAALARGPWRRRATQQAAAAALAAGDFAAMPLPAPTLRQDPALQRLRAALRELHEQRQRLRRLLDVLRAAETDAARRRGLDLLRVELDGPDRHADDALALRRPAPAAHAGRAGAVHAALAAALLLLAAWLAGA